MKKFIFASFLILIPSLTFASISENLYYGLQGNSEVTELQEFLADQGYLAHEPTGNFFSLTLSAVKKFQKMKGAGISDLGTELSA